MTLIVGINLVDYIILVSDKREVTMQDDKVIDITSDDINKIVDWNMGYVTGSGFVPVLSSLKEAIKLKKITHTDEIIELASSVSHKVFKNRNIPSELQDYWNQRTAWFVSYRTANVIGEPIMRLAFIEAGNKGEMSLVRDMDVVFSNKFEGSSDLRNNLVSNLRPTNYFNNLNESVNYHVNYLKNIYSLANHKLETVSKNFDVAIHLINGDLIRSWSDNE